MKEQEASNFLEKKVKAGTSESDAPGISSTEQNKTATIETAILALQSVVGSDLRSKDLEVALVSSDNTSFRTLTEAEIEAHLTAISERD